MSNIFASRCGEKKKIHVNVHKSQLVQLISRTIWRISVKKMQVDNISGRHPVNATYMQVLLDFVEHCFWTVDKREKRNGGTSSLQTKSSLAHSEMVDLVSVGKTPILLLWWLSSFNGVRSRWCLQVTVGADFTFKFPDTTSTHTAGVTEKCQTPPIRPQRWVWVGLGDGWSTAVPLLSAVVICSFFKSETI